MTDGESLAGTGPLRPLFSPLRGRPLRAPHPHELCGSSEGQGPSHPLPIRLIRPFARTTP